MSGRWIVSFLLLALSAGPCVAQPKDRIPAHMDEARVAVQGNVQPQADPRFDRGKVADTLALSAMTLFFNRTPEQQAELDSLLQQQHDRSSPNYHKWLTPQQFGERFGVSAGDMERVALWLQQQGFTILERSPARTYIAFSGTAAQAQAAFGTEIHNYEVKGVMHFANSSDPLLPRALADVTMGFRGLNDFRPKPRGFRPKPKFTSSISGNRFVVPDDFATIYHLKPLYDQGIDGTGQTIAVMGQTDIVQADINTFRQLSGLPAKAVTVQNVPNKYAPGVSSNDIGEADLDLEWSGAVARNATIIFVTTGNSQTYGAFDSLQYAITSNLAPVISISYGACEGLLMATDVNSFFSLFQQANAQGQTVVGPGGDEGAADCENSNATTSGYGLAVDFPADSPNVTGVGGTQFNDVSNEAQYWASANNSFGGSALSYVPEMVWNETAQNPNSSVVPPATCTVGSNCIIAAGGGGLSALQTIFGIANPKPAWQTALTPADGVRDVPDISMAAAFVHEGMLICASQQSPADCTNGFRDSSQNLDVIGGTSAGAPTFAGIVALLNQMTATTQGNLNTQLYPLAAVTTDAFHDITAGNNVAPCVPGTNFSYPSPNQAIPNGTCPGSGQIGYNAGAGYDYASGLGSVNAYALVSELANGTISTPPAADFTLANTGSTILNITAGSSGMVTISLAGMNGFSGTVTFSCIVPASLAGVTCTPPAPMGAPNNATFTITASSTAKMMPPGASPTFLAWNWGGGILVAGVLLGAGERNKTNRAARTTLLIVALLVVMALLLVGCGSSGSSGGGGGGGGGGPTPESGTVVLQGVSNADVHIVPITVNVN